MQQLNDAATKTTAAGAATIPESLLVDEVELELATQSDELVSPWTLDGGRHAGDALVALVNGVPWDLERVLEVPQGARELRVEYCSFEHPVGKATFWHSAAHVLGQALEAVDERALLQDGPPLPPSPVGGGFFYDAHMRGLHERDVERINAVAKDIVSARQPFERAVVSREEALEVFADNPYKQHVLRNVIPEGEQVTLYRCGDLVDLCRGPHVRHTGVIKAFEALNANGIQDALGDAVPAGDGASFMQRVYGIAFPSNKELKAWHVRREEAKKRDHRTIGVAQKLFMFDQSSPGSAFFLPHGTRIYNRLVDMLREEYSHRGYDEVRTPVVYNQSLWETSGHWENYKEHMFTIDNAETASEDGKPMGLKPMNCPGHCVMFAHERRSYKELPVRYADFGVLHRNELSGALSGLTRVRQFCQDDAHIFCTPEQVGTQVQECLQLITDVYSTFGMDFKVELSTRPESFLGTEAMWIQAESALAQSLQQLGLAYEINEGDGAFYGPKIDVHVRDAIDRHHQCATVQLDFQLPERFELAYHDHEGKQQRPVMIHRAVLGSVERMLAVLTEHYGGRWPFWLSPRQVQVCPVSEAHLPYAQAVAKGLRAFGLYADCDTSDHQLQKKIREAQVQQYNVILVVGDEEMTHSTCNVRLREGGKRFTLDLHNLTTWLVDVQDSKQLTLSVPEELLQPPPTEAGQIPSE